MLLYFDLFFEKISKKYFGFFPRIYSPRKFFPHDCLLVGHRFLERFLALCLRGFIVLRSYVLLRKFLWPMILLRLSSLSTCFCVPPHVLRLIPPGFPVVIYDGHLTVFLRLLSLVSAEIHLHGRVFFPAFFLLCIDWKYTKEVMLFRISFCISHAGCLLNKPRVFSTALSSF